MKKQIFLLLFLQTSYLLVAQEVKNDSIRTRNLDEVIVKGIRVSKNAPVTHTNLTKEELEKRNLGQDIPILMSYMPSVVTTSDAGTGIGYSSMRVRGSDATRINVTINGIPYNDSESHGTYWVNIGDIASSSESIQLQRGAGTSVNGSSAFGASINVLTDKVSKDASGEISNSVGSFGTRKHTIKYSTGLLNKHVELSGRMSKIYSDGYVERSFADLNSYFLQATYKNDNTIIKALSFGGKERTYQSWYGLTLNQLKENRRQNPYTYDNETDNYNQNHYQFHFTQQLLSQFTVNLGLNYTKGAGYYEQYKKKQESFSFKNLIADTSDVIVRRWLDNDFIVSNFTANYKNKGLDIIFGTSANFYTNDHFGEVIWASDLAPKTKIRDRYYFNKGKKSGTSTFLKANFKVSPKLRAYMDIQGRFINYMAKGIDNNQNTLAIKRDFNFLNPKAGLTYKLGSLNSIYFSYARANREPNRDDLIFNSETKEESLDDYEFGWRIKGKNLTLNANLYYMDYVNQLVLTGEINDVGAKIRKNTPNSYRTGIELDANIKLGNKFIWRPNFSYSKHRNVSFKANILGKVVNLGNTPISFSPDIILGNIFTYIPIENLQLSVLSKYVGKQHMSNLENKINGKDYNDILEDYFISDLNITYEIRPDNIFNSIVFSGLINNILNTEYVSNGYFGYSYSVKNKSDYGWSGYYPQATRNFLLGATFKF